MNSFLFRAIAGFLVSFALIGSSQLVLADTGGGGGGGGSYIPPTTVISTGQTIVLAPGWNTFSTPKVLDSISFQSGGVGLYFYILTPSGWQTITPTATTIQPLGGFMVNNTNSTDSIVTLNYKQDLTPLEKLFQKNLHTGWNIVGITTIFDPFSTIESVPLSVDFTRSSGGQTNYANRVAGDFFVKNTSSSNHNFLLGESYAVFLPTAREYGGAQGTETISVPVVPPTNGGSGTTSGNLTVAIDGTAFAQYVPPNASSVKVGAVKLTAGTSDVTVLSLVVSRSGLGNASDITSTNGVRAAQNGIVISSTADSYDPTSQKATVYFSPALIIPAGTNKSIDILVNLSGSSNSQHQFTLDSVNAANATVTAAPITLGLLNTTSYMTTTTTASLSVAAGAITTGKANQLFAKIDISAGGRQTKVTGFTLTRSGSTDFTKRLTNVMVYKNGVSVGTVTMNSEKLSVSGLADILDSGNTQTYELRADILVDANSTVLGIKLDATTDVNTIEMATGYSTQVTFGTSNIAITFGAVEFTFTKSSTGNVTIAPGTNNVKLFDGKLQSTTPVSVRQITVSSANTGTGITAFVNDQLSVKLNGSEIGTLTTLGAPQVLLVSFVIDAANPAVLTVEGSTKNNTNIAPSSNQFTVALTEVRDSSNNSITSLGAGSNLTGDKVTVNTSEVEIKTATVAAPSTSRIYSSAEQEIGRFALTSRNEVARLQSVTLTGVTTGGTLQQIANSTSSAKLVDVATGLEVSATVSISNNTITFSSMNDTIAKDVTKNYKVILGVSSVDSYYGMTVTLGTVNPADLSIVRDSNSTSVTPIGNAYTKTYTVGTVAPTVLVTSINENTFKVRVTNPDSNTGITLSGATFDFKTALPGSTTYAATACLRDLGNTNTCSGSGTSGTGSIPALSQYLSMTGGLTTNMKADKNGGYVEFEVYITSANLLPTGAQLQVALTHLNYTVAGTSDTETYVGTTGASASFTK